MGKQTRLFFPESDLVSTEPLELVHMDACGPMPVASVGRSWYFATFLDDYNKLSVVVPLKQKSEVARITEHVIKRLELQLGKQLKSVRTDRGKEYVNKALEDVFGGKGTVHEKTAPYSAEQNGSAERLNRDFKEKTRAMLEDSGFAKELWAEAVVTANYTRNRTPVSAHGRTPWEVFFGEKPTVGHMRVLGAWAFRHVPKQRRRKLDPRYSARERCAPGEWYRANLAAEPKAGEHLKGTGEHEEPRNYQEAVRGEEGELWRKSMDEEMRSLLENGTWELAGKTGRGELEEEIYCQQPKGYEQGGPNMVCHLKRTLYGLRQAPRAWHMRLKEELGNFEFVASMADAALFTGKVAGERVYIVVWVDDILVAARGAERIAKAKAHLGEKFDVRDLGEAKYFLGMELTRDREARTLKLIQKKLTGELVGLYGLASARARSVPLATGDRLTKEGEPLV
ncbi:Ribonuclease H-like superfamily protein with integrase and polymerase domains [Klebsormidium nitens]|uniref:Ribonuclease H-like superfamily protein with integrase and polymerase domains n=1 Tax=Klebsormidium nitens TaxID=105231 RepID=A0A1Y1IU33_KLENI|nr:Ribonuclease H-like superfamily protein with integrase and polymerase domains [Klebsormidium nitens]|eukprot:GAQ93602.1 Ribonuclease H-like superfamily protein with integrase and polymerase domains [Klebsormidium nitens]